MALYIDSVVTHGTSGTGDDTVPPGIGAGIDWCHMVSDANALELITFLTVNILTVGSPATNIRTPALGALQTYVGLDVNQRTAAITAGAHPGRNPTVATKSFDTTGATAPPQYEP